MALIPVQFTYLTGLKQDIFRHAYLIGSWDKSGYYADQWTSSSMHKTTASDGCLGFIIIIQFDTSQIAYLFRWGVILENLEGRKFWGIPTEVNDERSTERYRSFTLESPNEIQSQQECYYLTHCRRLGAQKHYRPGQAAPAIRFAVWAPNAQKVKVVFGNLQSGYIANDGSGIDPVLGTFELTRGKDDIWKTKEDVLGLEDFAKFDHKPYMFKINQEDGAIAYRTDLYSRCQIGKGNIDPDGKPYTGSYTELDGTKSCSVVVDPDTVTRYFQEPTWPEVEFIPAEDFWQNEFNPNYPVPRRVEDLVIYELHIGALGFGQNRPGNFEDALQLIPYLVDLGINAVELLPMSEFRDEVNWGYETSHYFAVEYSAGGRDQLKFFVRECHRNGIAIILDVVYNHYHPSAERAQWAYDSNISEHNIYYWYEGNSTSYWQREGGYVDNESTGYTPRFYEEMVRKLFISSAAMLLEEFHIDGFRVDQTTSMHLYNKLHADGRPLGNVNTFGAKFLREWTRTMKLIHPSVMLIAEDHSDWDQVTESSEVGGLGFDAAWYANFYHHLIGDTRQGTEYAKLIPTAGYGTNEPLAIDHFAGALGWSGHKKVTYHESHDEAGNSSSPEKESRRTILAAVDSAPLVGETRRCAEARCRFAFGMAMLSAGTPMFLMGEEIGAQKPYRYRDFMNNREDLLGDCQGIGAKIFRFYQDLIRFRYAHSAIKSHNIDIINVHNLNRVLAFRRWDETEELLVIASLNNTAFTEGYTIESFHLGNGRWQEVFNSDATVYGGDNVGNAGSMITATSNQIHAIIPANGLCILRKE